MKWGQAAFGGRAVDRIELRSMGARLLSEARALRAAFPDGEAMRALPVSPLSPEVSGQEAVRAALVYLRDEMLLVRSGKANELGVLDDEIARVERLLAAPRGD
jgi:hypothetical protein